MAPAVPRSGVDSVHTGVAAAMPNLRKIWRCWTTATWKRDFVCFSHSGFMRGKICNPDQVFGMHVWESKGCVSFTVEGHGLWPGLLLLDWWKLVAQLHL